MRQKVTGETESYTIERIDDSTWRIDEGGAVNFYLLSGQRRALLIDTGCGSGDINACVKFLTNLPVTVTVTHRHPDHAGGVRQFSCYYAPAGDCASEYDMLCSKHFRKKALGKVNGGRLFPDRFHETIIPFQDGKVFDLGGRAVVARSAPGHTAGATYYVDSEHRYVFTGDDVDPHLQMQMDGCTSLEAWVSGAERILALLQEGYQGWYGHGDGRQEDTQVEQTIALAREVIVKARSGEHFPGMGSRFYYPSKEALPNLYLRRGHILAAKK